MGGVLLDLNMQACWDGFKAIGCEDIGKIIDPYIQSGIFLKLEEGTITPEELYKEIRETLCPTVTGEQINNALYNIIEGIAPYKLPMLLDLRAKGYKVYMLSNTNAIVFPYVKEHFFTSRGLNIEDYFDKLFLSYEMHAVKPHDEIFKQIIAQGVNPAETLFIDDAAANIEAGKKFGFHTYLAKPKEDYRHIFEEL